MKAILSILIVICCSVGCQQSDDCNDNDQICGEWNLVQVSGGFAGVNDSFDAGTILWIFQANSHQLKVENNHTGNSLYNGLATGTYSYEIIALNDKQFITINNEEMGQITLEQSNMIIDQNSTTQGAGADGFILSLKR